MARYVYACTACSKKFEVEKPMAAAAEPSPCPACQAPGRRVFTPPGIAVKGSPVKFSEAKEDGPSSAAEAGCGGCGNGACPWN